MSSFPDNFLAQKYKKAADITHIQKAAHKMLVKLTPRVNFTNILLAAFAPLFLRQKSTNLKSQYKKALRETFVQKAAHKMLVKLTPVVITFVRQESIRFDWILK
jgi:hypothetical protein